MTDALERAVGFLDGPNGPLFYSASLTTAGGDRPPGVVVVQPFGEEMNKSRHLLAAIVRRLGARGVCAVMPDLHGTGDSAGDFGDATLDRWRQDLDAVVASLLPRGPIDIVGLRFGGLLAADLAGRHPVRSLVLLHPVVDGRQQLVQMLRVRLASGMVSGGTRERLGDLLQRFETGASLEVAGYRLSAALAAGMQTLKLAELPPRGAERVAWLELAVDDQRPLMPSSQAVVDDWATFGVTASSEVVACDQFWATQEIATCDALVERAVTQVAGAAR